MQRCVFMVFKTFLALTLLKSFKHGLFHMKFGKQYFLVIVIKWLEWKTLVLCLKLRVKLRF